MPGTKKSATKSRQTSTATTPARGKGRPRANGTASVDAQQEILKAAAFLFSRDGVKATTISDIAKTIGVRPPSVYYYYADKEDILHALLEFVDKSAAFAVEISNSAGTPSEKLHALFSDQVQRMVNAPYDLWFVTSGIRRYAYRHKSILRQSNVWRSKVAALVKEGVDSGEFLPIKRHMALAMVSGVMHGAFDAKSRGMKVDPNEVASMYLRLLGKAD